MDLELGEVGPGAEPYPRNACWAKPDLDAAADGMRQLYDHGDVATEIGRSAREGVPATHDATTAVASFGERFGALTGAGADR